MSVISKAPNQNVLMDIFKAHMKNELEKQLMDQIMPAIKANVKEAAEKALASTEVFIHQNYDRFANEFTLGLLIKEKT